MQNAYHREPRAPRQEVGENDCPFCKRLGSLGMFEKAGGALVRRCTRCGFTVTPTVKPKLHT